MKKLLLSLAIFLVYYSGKAAERFEANIYGDSVVNLKSISVTAAKQTSEVEITSASTSINRTDIERQRILTAREASALVPNLHIPDYGSRITSTIYVRGMGARIDQPVMGMVVDNVPIINKDSYDFDIADIERIQVLRGPQSTLYGRNTMGGVISISTLSPLSYQGCRLLAEYGNENSVKASLSHYNRPSRQFGIGGNVYVSHTDGFFTNNHNGEKADKETDYRGMLKAAWKPSDRIIVENMASIGIVRQGGYAYEFIDTHEINYNDTCFYRRTSVLDAMTVKYQKGNYQLTSVTSYQMLDDNMTLDQDFLPMSYFTLTQKKREHAVTQDFIAKSTAINGRLRWLSGVFGFYRKIKMDAPVTFLDYGIDQLITSKWNAMNDNYPCQWDSDTFILGSGFMMPSYGAAAYGEVSMDFNSLTLVGGVRVDHEGVKLDYNSDCSTSYSIMHRLPDGSLEHFRTDPVEIHNRGSLKRSFTEVLPKIAAYYKLGNTTVVRLTVAKGYKAGGFNTNMFSDVLQQQLMNMMGVGHVYDTDEVIGYEPEKSWNYEIGANYTSADGTLSAEASAFYIDCRNQQITVFPDGDVTGRIMTNAGKSRSAGVELAATWYPTTRLQLSASYGYTNAKFVKFDNGKENYKGKYVPYAPQNTIFASANYTFPISSELLRFVSLNVSTVGTGKIYWNEENDVCQPIYFKLNASARFAFNKFSIDLWGKNLTSTNYDTFYFVSIKHGFVQRGKPLQCGVTLRVTI